jgi:hypothetical protein
MRGKTTNLQGASFGRLRVVARAENSAKGAARWVVVCSCGVSKTVRGSSLTDGTTTSCGCWGREASAERARTHGMTSSFEYRAWASMWKRCTYKKHPAYNRYGGAGIVVCPEWKSFERFYTDMGPCPFTAGSVDRIDNTRGYTPDNCRWLPKSMQSKNRKHVLLIGGKTVGDLAKANGVKETTLRRRIKAGWSAERLFLTPAAAGTRRV